MCWNCHHPGSTVADYLDHLLRVVHERCWAVQAVDRDRPRPA